MTDPQLSLIVTDRINPRDQVTLMPGVDAVCECAARDAALFAERADAVGVTECLWPFCRWKGDPSAYNDYAPPTKEDE